MAFIVIGPGIRDPIKLDTLFDRRPVEKTGAIWKSGTDHY